MFIGAQYLGSEKAFFQVWAPFQKNIYLHIISPQKQIIALNRAQKPGYWSLTVEGIKPGSRYLYQFNSDKEFPDPASYFQPQGVHGPSLLVDHAFFWKDRQWQGIPLKKMVIYELHIGTFTPKGLFTSVLPRLPDLKALGINALEIMPVAQFSGKRNWGYDGVYPFAVQNSYGGPNDFKNLINSCHLHGIAVILDVVYNHLGPEGNYLPQFGPYFTEKYQSNWGKGINFDGPYSDEVRNYFIQNALYWLEKYHIDALRLDAIHGIFDMRANHFLSELAKSVCQFSHKKQKKTFLIAESDLNDVKIIQSTQKGGYQQNAQWSDDFHHALHTLLTKEDDGYYQDFGLIRHLAKAINEGFVYSGQYSAYRKKSHGNSSRRIPPECFITYIQNHDQIGNRRLGERMSGLVSFEALKLAAAITLLSPYIPLLFMGEEYGETHPFLYFIDHQDDGLIRAVREGRKKEFSQFGWQQEPPDPQNKQTFIKSRIVWSKRKKGYHRVLWDFYQDLIQLRKQYSVLQCPERNQIHAWGIEKDKILFQKRQTKKVQFLLISHFNDQNVSVQLNQQFGFRSWFKVIDSCENRWLGSETNTPETLTCPTNLILKSFQFLLFQQKE
mgnify:CR=1 FL=1